MKTFQMNLPGYDSSRDDTDCLCGHYKKGNL